MGNVLVSLVLHHEDFESMLELFVSSSATPVLHSTMNLHQLIRGVHIVPQTSVAQRGITVHCTMEIQMCTT